MSKGLLFALPIVLAAILGLVLNGITVYAPWFAGATLLLGIFAVAFYIRNTRKQDNHEPGGKP